MDTIAPGTLVLESRHTGERIELRRRPAGAGDSLEIQGLLPAGRPSMSVHAHHGQTLRLHVRSGVLHALVGGRNLRIPAGETLEIPPGTPYRFWNEQNHDAAYEGEASPAGDLDRYLQAYSQVVNAGERNSPPLTYLARVQLRHADTQTVNLLWGPAQTLLFMGVALFGAMTGRYRGDDWPGADARCPGAPPVSREGVPEPV